ncbi:NifB/NifX family molybdenum-iron cluster-binding protein [Treponema sp.]|uniref:NifB/NifX family molybdenum-iron cluster-binding protein n=1 Tax=Treponema sp. TaxID=166 RepID=UPI0025D87999|nr:NifB/NifX family molybdenum-iron cluster-binding protein [Treponema sp.]MCR5218462.1 DUF134 domain-containing protein [Treponema sp.]
MPRPVRCRQIKSLPEYWTFATEEGCTNIDVVMSLDELETIRLLDCAGLTQEECAAMMNVARTTVTALYDSARKKVADCLVNGNRLVISGGSWQLSQQPEIPNTLKDKGDKTMRIAVTYENGNVFQHFGHTEEFKIYDVEDNKIVKTEVTGTNGQGHGALAGFLKTANVDVLICGGIGGGAQSALAEAGIKLYGGVNGKADDAVNALLSDSLQYNPDVKCNHHGEGHEHNCGSSSHSCGSHGAGHCGSDEHKGILNPSK